MKTLSTRLFLAGALVLLSSIGVRAEEMSISTLKEHLPTNCFTNTAGTPEPMVVNGHRLTADQSENVDWIRRCVVPILPGTRSNVATLTSRATWWSLREGVLSLPTARIFRYSTCHERFKGKVQDHMTSNDPLHLCGTNIWQVGIAAGQVANYSDAQVGDAIDNVFRTMDPRVSDDAVLGWTATLAGYEEGNKTYNAILDSRGKVRRSWMLRNPAIGILLMEKLEVESECMREKKRWCFNGNYPDAKNFSGNTKGMLRSMADLRTILLRPSKSLNPPHSGESVSAD